MYPFCYVLYPNRHIHIYISVPNSTHLTCALDDQPFKTYKQTVDTMEDDFLFKHKIGRAKITAPIHCRLSVKAMKKSLTPEIIASSVKNVGLIPWCPEKFVNDVASLPFAIDAKDVSKSTTDSDNDNQSPPKKRRKLTASSRARQALSKGGEATHPDFIQLLSNPQ